MRQSLKDALSSLPHPLINALTPLLSASTFDGTLSPENVASLCSIANVSPAALTEILLPLAAAYSIAPISQFYVGAIATGTTGRLYFGANMEFIGTPLNQSVHAEQSAINHAWLKGERGISAITVNYSPCGHCRQFMNELVDAEKLVIQLPKQTPQVLHFYLPHAFGPQDLGSITPLLSDKDNKLTPFSPLLKEKKNPVCHAAWMAANECHAPYSKHPSGIAIQTHEGHIFSGRYAENAAFNPSLPPLQSALIMMNLANVPFSSIKEVVLVELQNHRITHAVNTQQILEQINPASHFTHHLV